MFYKLLLFIILFVLCGCESEQGRFEKAKEEGSTAAYLKFIEDYPKGELNKQAKLEIEKIYFNKNKNIHGYKAYLMRYPKGAFVKEAKQEIENFYKESFTKQQDSEKITEEIKGLPQDVQKNIMEHYQKEVVKAYEQSSVDPKLKSSLVKLLMQALKEGKPANIHLSCKGVVVNPGMGQRPRILTVEEISKEVIRRSLNKDKIQDDDKGVFKLETKANEESIVKEIKDKFSKKFLGLINFTEEKCATEFQVSYVLTPSDNWYSFIDSRKGNLQFQGIGLDGQFTVISNGKKIYQFNKERYINKYGVGGSASSISNFYSVQVSVHFSLFTSELYKVLNIK